MALPAAARSLEADEGLDNRNATLLVDETRRLFLANLHGGAANSYAVLYAQASSWIRHAEACFERTKEPKWAAFAERWKASVLWLDYNLILSGSNGGKRSQQLVQALMGEQGQRHGADVMLQMTGQAPAAPAQRRGWIFRR